MLTLIDLVDLSRILTSVVNAVVPAVVEVSLVLPVLLAGGVIVAMVMVAVSTELVTLLDVLLVLENNPDSVVVKGTISIRESLVVLVVALDAPGKRTP